MKNLMTSNYSIAKKVFIDTIEIDDYIELSSSLTIYTQLEKIIDKPLKMILLFGKPGTGKSILLTRLQNNLKHQKEIHYFPTPATNEKEFYGIVFKILTQKDLPEDTEVNFSALIQFCESILGKREIIMLLDEAQMYSPNIMEKIRLLSDTRVVKFVIALHKTEDEDLIAKEHFQTRIWESLELINATVDEQKVYIHKKLLKHNLFDVANSLDGKELKLVHKFTEGNYRECNKLLYTIFEICEYYEEFEPQNIDLNHISKKMIEMAGLKLGYIHA
ncbi:MAG: ATP-binding protein [Campylobacterota bacterium]|nr:ATP-binding protein [Campylobacterota bacterium]